MAFFSGCYTWIWCTGRMIPVCKTVGLLLQDLRQSRGPKDRTGPGSVCQEVRRAAQPQLAASQAVQPLIAHTPTTTVPPCWTQGARRCRCGHLQALTLPPAFTSYPGLFGSTCSSTCKLRRLLHLPAAHRTSSLHEALVRAQGQHRAAERAG